jgi:hypothetical protein
MKSAHEGLAVWMLPNVLALDAPLVAITWQWFLARQFGVEVTWASTAVLALAAWSIYLIDRRVDAARGAVGTARHAFAARYPRWLLSLGILAGVGAMAIAPWAPRPLQLPGYALGAVVVGYLVVVHRARAAVARVSGYKEALVALCFGAGTCLVLLGAEPLGAVIGAVILFIHACWANCRLIDSWEGGPGLRRAEVALWLLLGAVGSVLTLTPVAIVHWLVLATFALLDFAVAPRHRELARCLIDFAMVVPVLAWWIL